MRNKDNNPVFNFFNKTWKIAGSHEDAKCNDQTFGTNQPGDEDKSNRSHNCL